MTAETGPHGIGLRMAKVVAELLFLCFAALFLTLLALGVWQLHQMNIINLSALNFLPQWLIDIVFVVLPVFCIWVFSLIWNKARRLLNT